MAWRRSGYKPFSEQVIVYGRIYALLDLSGLIVWYQRIKGRNIIHDTEILNISHADFGTATLL